MLRKRLLGFFTMTCAIAVMGCGGEVDTARQSDAPVKAGPTVDKKGKKGKSVEMSIELPSTPAAPPAKK